MKKIIRSSITFLWLVIAIGCNEDPNEAIDMPNQELKEETEPTTEEENLQYEEFEGTFCFVLGDSLASPTDTLYYESKSQFSGKEVPTEYLWHVVEGEISIASDPHQSSVEVAFLNGFTGGSIQLKFYSEAYGYTPESNPYCSETFIIALK